MGSSHPQIILYIAVTLIMIAGLMLISIFLLVQFLKRRHKHYMEVKAMKDEHDKALLTAKVEMQETTLQVIARELHDNIKPRLVLSRLNLYTKPLLSAEELYRKINSTAEMIEITIGDVNNLSRSLNSDWIRGQGLIMALEEEIEKLKSTGLYSICDRISIHRVELEAEKELHMFRIAQEALSNILKHAGAKTITFLLYYMQSATHLVVSDDGKGFECIDQDDMLTGTGLKNMKARAQLINGDIEITSTLERGTMVHLTVPYKPTINSYEN